MLPRVQAIPMQNEDVSFRISDIERLRYNTGLTMLRPYLFPVIGPGGRMATRMGHPHDPVTHRHHYSLWVAHANVGGVDFWADHGLTGRQVHTSILAIEDGDGTAAIALDIAWRTPDGRTPLRETRTYRMDALPGGELLVEVSLELTAPEAGVTFGATPFGLAAVRMAKTMSVADGGGTITNSEGAEGEEAILWKPARWCDYSGPVTDYAVNGVSLFSHPANGSHPCDWHVRSDGWMGACLSREAERVVPAGTSLPLRYAYYVHAGPCDFVRIEGRFGAFEDSAFRPCQH